METILNKKKLARHAGIFYLLMLFGAVGLVYTPSLILDEHNATATFRNLIDHEFLFRIGIITNVICQIAFIFLAIKLFQLFEGVNRFLSLSLLSIVIASVPVSFILIHFQLDTAFLVQQKFLTDEEIQSSVQWSMLQFKHGLTFIGIFWGLWLIPFGILIVKSGFLPKFIGYLLIAGGITYILDATVFVLLGEVSSFVQLLNAIFPTLAELSAIAGLLIAKFPHEKKKKI